MSIKHKRRYWKRVGIIVALATVIFVAQNRIRQHSNANLPTMNQNLSACVAPDSVLTTSDSLTAIFDKVERHRCIVPPHWYSTNGYMTPMVAGFIDGGWQLGVSVQQLAVFTHCYLADTACRSRTNRDFDLLWQNRAELPALLGNQAFTWAGNLSGNAGAAEAEYLYGRLLFDAATMLVGVGEISEGLQTAKLSTKVVRAVETLRLQKLARIEALCPACAEFFKNTNKLRENLLPLDETKQLLNSEFVKSGKTWEAFIKDYDAHHIIPVDMLETSDGLRFYFNNGGKLNFNGQENGIMLKKLYLGGVHSNHPQYTAEMLRKIDMAYASIQKAPISVQNKVNSLDVIIRKEIAATRQLIINDGVGKNIKINNIFNH